jgi:hypothetical protein
VAGVRSGAVRMRTRGGWRAKWGCSHANEGGSRASRGCSHANEGGWRAKWGCSHANEGGWRAKWGCSHANEGGSRAKWGCSHANEGGWRAKWVVWAEPALSDTVRHIGPRRVSSRLSRRSRLRSVRVVAGRPGAARRRRVPSPPAANRCEIEHRSVLWEANAELPLHQIQIVDVEATCVRSRGSSSPRPACFRTASSGPRPTS